MASTCGKREKQFNGSAGGITHILPAAAGSECERSFHAGGGMPSELLTVDPTVGRLTGRTHPALYKPRAGSHSQRIGRRSESGITTPLRPPSPDSAATVTSTHDLFLSVSRIPPSLSYPILGSCNPSAAVICTGGGVSIYRRDPSISGARARVVNR
jgi:hypothetical protein